MVESYIVIDLETTGLDPKKDKIIEVGMIKVIHNEIVDQYTSFVNPRRKIKPEITALTGITDQDLKDAPDIETVIGDVICFCSDFPVIGHFVIFDYSFLKRAAVNCGKEFEKTGIDTLKLCRNFMPEDSKKSLKEACLYFGIEQHGAHRAFEDAFVTNQLYQIIKIKHGAEHPDAFQQKALIYQVKKEQPATKRQKEYLHDLSKYHKIDMDLQIEYLTRNEVSRLIDQIISQYGKMIKR